MASDDVALEPGFVANSQARVTVYEGRRNHVYLDSKNIPTVGIGFNLDRADAATVLTTVGADLDSIRAGRADLTDPQIDAIFTSDMKNAVASARDLIPNFDSLSDARKFVMVDMAFNMGKEGLSEFKGTLAAVDRGDFATAADHMQQSAWYGQVGNRSVSDCAMMRSGDWTQIDERGSHLREDSPKRVLEIGTRGADVSSVQRSLGIVADGDFGPKTERAVEAFQRSHGLVADGVVGDKTFVALEKANALADREKATLDHGHRPGSGESGLQQIRQALEAIGDTAAEVKQFAVDAAKTVVEDLGLVAASGRESENHQRIAERIAQLKTDGVRVSPIAKGNDSVVAYDNRAHNGTFVDIGHGEVAQHIGRGEYMLYDVARDLHGIKPPEGVNLDVNSQGRVGAAHDPALGHDR